MGYGIFRTQEDFGLVAVNTFIIIGFGLLTVTPASVPREILLNRLGKVIFLTPLQFYIVKYIGTWRAVYVTESLIFSTAMLSTPVLTYHNSLVPQDAMFNIFFKVMGLSSIQAVIFGDEYTFEKGGLFFVLLALFIESLSITISLFSVPALALKDNHADFTRRLAKGRVISTIISVLLLVSTVAVLVLGFLLAADKL
jgi:hypothetical protein